MRMPAPSRKRNSNTGKVGRPPAGDRGERVKDYPQVSGKVMSNIYLMAMDIYSEKDNRPKIAEYGDKAIAKRTILRIRPF